MRRVDAHVPLRDRLSLDAYRSRDVRVRCAKCRGWMRYKPTEATPLVRRKAPHAGHCVECAVAQHWGATHG